MSYILTNQFWIIVFKWQTLITGFLAVVAALLTIHATNKAADREISAAQGQTAASQKQTAVTLDLEQKRIARESYAFHAMLSASMTSILDDISESRTIFVKEPRSGVDSRSTYTARQTVRKMAFEELRSACISFGGQLTAPILKLEKEIDFFAAQWIPLPTAGDHVRSGLNANFDNQLNDINKLAQLLLTQANEEMMLCLSVLEENTRSRLK